MKGEGEGGAERGGGERGGIKGGKVVFSFNEIR